MIVEVLREAAFDDVYHDGYRSGRAGGGSEHGNEAVVCCAYELGTELKDATVYGILFDDLYALTCYFHVPVVLVGEGKEFF